MNKFTFNWGVVIAAIVLLFYAYIAFNGSLYLDFVNGNVLWSALFAAVLIFIVCVCVYVMCVARATRWKGIGTTGQVMFGLIIFVTFCVAGIPFASFLNAAGNMKTINESVHEVQTAAKEMDAAYFTYVDNRVEEYKELLRKDSTLYYNAGGVDDDTKINNLSQSLKNHILPDGIDKVKMERSEWLNGVKSLSIWNIHTPNNLSHLAKCIDDGVAEYARISSLSYKGETYGEFKYKKFSDNIEKLKKNIGGVHYSIWSVLVAVICSMFMLLPYFLTRPSLAGRDTINKKNNYRKNDIEEPDYE